MDEKVDLIMINQQEEEQLRSRGVPNIRMILLAFPFIPNIILILGIKGKASGFPRCTCAVAGSGFNFFIETFQAGKTRSL